MCRNLRSLPESGPHPAYSVRVWRADRVTSGEDDVTDDVPADGTATPADPHSQRGPSTGPGTPTCCGKVTGAADVPRVPRASTYHVPAIGSLTDWIPAWAWTQCVGLRSN